jgi:fumarate hydratase class I
METITAERIGSVAYQLLANTGIKYPKNYLDKLIQHFRTETDPGAKSVLASILQNIIFAVEEPASLCQDTGVPVFHVYLNPRISIKGDIEAAITEATAKATEEVPIRKNVIEPFSFENPGTNTGWGVPFIYYHYGSNPGPLRMRAELKGFGGEIKSTSDWIFTSTESMEDAVLSYVLHNVMLSKGEGCMPGLIGVGVGGYAGEAVSNAKSAVFRELTEKQPASPEDDFIGRVEDRIYRCVNQLGLGPMGGGGNTTTLGVYLERRGTHTAVAPVAVSNQCWASRASEALVTENSIDYVTRHVEPEDLPSLNEILSMELSKLQTEGDVYRLNTPVPIDDLLKLRVGDVVYLDGTICTARDGAHRRMVDLVRSGENGKIPKELLDHGSIYHMGPVITKAPDGWSINAAGPTTSSRFTDDAAVLIENGIINFIVGKGTMGPKTIDALKGKGVYLKAVGGCAVTYKRSILQNRVEWLDLGFPEAVWIMTVKDFGPLVVGIDAAGNSLAENVMETVYENARQIYREEGLDPKKRYVQYPQTVAGLSLEELIQKG